MTKLLGPYPLSVANPKPFDVEWDQVPQPPIGVDLENISGILLEADIAGQPFWLPPWTARYFDVPANSIKLTVQPHTDISPAQADPLRLVATLYQQGDTALEKIERSLSGLAVVAAISGQVALANGTVVGLTAGNAVGINGNVTNTPLISSIASGTINQTIPSGLQPVVTSTVNVNPPGTTRSLIVITDFGTIMTPVFFDVSVTGITDGFQYDYQQIKGSSMGNNVWELICPANADPAGFHINFSSQTVTGPGTTTFTYKILADVNDAAGTSSEPFYARLTDANQNLLGVANDPLVVELQDINGNQQGVPSAPLIAQLQDGNANNVGIVQAHPFYVRQNFLQAGTQSGTISVTHGATVACIGAPAAGTINWIDSISVVSNMSFCQALTVQGASSGRVYAQFVVPSVAVGATNTSASPTTMKIDQGVTEQVNVTAGNSGTSPTGTFGVTISFRNISNT